MVETLRQDVLFSLRMIRRNPGFAATAVLTLALGIGANTAIFTVVRSVLLKPLDYAQPDRIVRVTGGATAARFDMLRGVRSFQSTAAYTVFTDNVALATNEGPEPLKGTRVSANFLTVLGVAPLRGRTFSPQEEAPGSNAVLISAELWDHKFGRDLRIVGHTANIAGVSHTIIGVLPPAFPFPSPGLDIWRTWQDDLLPEPVRRNSPILGVIARLREGVTIDAANAEVAIVNRQYAQTHIGALDAKSPQEALTPLQEYLVRDIRPTLWTLFGAVGFLLLIACANVASLLLARATGRTREFAIRAALGAGGRRLAAQLLTESLLLALAGGACGVLIARWSLRVLEQLPGLELPSSGAMQLDATVLAFALAIAAVTSLLFGLAPSLHAARLDLTAAMRTSGAQTDKRPLMQIFVVGQVALSVVLLIGATLLTESLARLQRVDTGFQPANLLSMKIALPQAKHEELIRRVESIPGVRAAAVTLTLPMTGFAGTPVQALNQPLQQLNQRPIATLQTVSPGYFKTLGVALRRGRDFDTRDTRTAPLVAVINEGLARRFWPSYPNGEDPVGQNILIGANPAPVRVIGIVGDVRQASLAEQASPGVYRPRTQTPEMSAMFAVRTDGDPMRYVNAIRRELAAIDPNQAISEVRTMDAVIEASESRRHSILLLLGLFAGTGLLLSTIGIYGVVAYSVARRSREMGIRKALGAQSADIMGLVVRQGFRLALAGAALGLVAAAGLTRLMESLLFQISPTDPMTFLGVSLLLVVVAVVASYLPARTATSVEPIEALKAE